MSGKLHSCFTPSGLTPFRLSRCIIYHPFIVPSVLLSAFRRILPFLYSFNATHPVHSCHRRLVFQTQRWTAALDSVALKCISYKILPFCERVIFRKSVGNRLFVSPCKASVNPKRFRQNIEPNRGKKNKSLKFHDNGQHQRKQRVQTCQRIGNGSE